MSYNDSDLYAYTAKHTVNSLSFFQFVEELLTAEIVPSHTYTPYFRIYVAYRLYLTGKKRSEETRTTCDVACKIINCRLDEVAWVQCETPWCGSWAHTFCVDQPPSFKGPYTCPMC